MVGTQELGGTWLSPMLPSISAGEGSPHVGDSELGATQDAEKRSSSTFSGLFAAEAQAPQESASLFGDSRRRSHA